MKVILFIGHHKVGSTALQDFFSRNKVALIRAGILYPSTDFQGMAMALANATGRSEMPQEIPLNAREPHNALAFRMLHQRDLGPMPPFHKQLPAVPQMKIAIRNQIEYLQPHTVLLASEVFSNFARGGPEIIRDLLSIFPPSSDITILATLRRIDEYLASWHGQRLKFGHHLAPLRNTGGGEYFDGIHFDYRMMLRDWIETLPRARFILRDYREVRAAGGSVADLVGQTGLKLPDGLHSERNSNLSLHRGVYEIARLGNHALDPEQARQLREVLRQITPELNLPASQDIEMFGAKNRAWLAEQFAPIHDYLRQVTDRDTFFKDIDAVTALRPVPEMDAHRRALVALNRHLPRFTDPAVRDFLSDLAR